MKRSVIHLAKNTLAMTLPNKWASTWGVKPKDLLDVSEHGNELIISTHNNVSTQPKKVNVFGSFKHIRRQISIPYRQGVDALEVHFEDPADMKKIQKTLEITLGYEILSRGPHHCVIKDVANLNENDFEQLSRRYFNVTLALAKDTLTAMEAKDLASLQNLEQLFDTQSKLFLACERLVNKASFRLHPFPVFLYIFIDSLEGMGDHIERIVNFLKSEGRIEIGKEPLNLFRKEVKLIEDLQTMYFDFDPKLGDKMMVTREEIEESAKRLLPKAKLHDAIILHHLFNLNWSISEGLSDIYGLKM